MVSIIVPVYNNQDHIGKCIQSLINQDYKQIEIILVDDGSWDSSGNICDQYARVDSRIKVIRKQNGGVSSARNIGIQEAKGNYILFVDGDDWLERDAITKMYDMIKKYGANVCFCDRYYRNKTETKISVPFQENVIDNSVAVLAHLKFQFISSVWLMMIDSSIAKQCYFNQDIHTLEDWEYIFRVLTLSKRICICRFPLYHYTTVAGSASKSPLNSKKMSCFLIPTIIRKYILDNKLPYLELTDCLEIRLLNQILVIAANYGSKDVYNRQLKEIARKHLKKCLKSKDILLRQKIYTIMTSISPRIFYILYRIKNRKMRYYE